ncbi:cytochrome-c oxidase, cbb3-type subunit III [Agrobacterium vitis]|uniref:Cbb3-type cytochrome c oxidase subunit n=2 Tax=Alphaproteobacteria TaxID=28211 RepID=A0A512HM26_9HYPH|nr:MULTISPECIES: cytochrome-c oxidase, cbb3-type subunit III [Alphaproteobacteria]MCF1494454.1 cytochrome-c oxidase, cbb3-type subunit III [Allorhizobium ampelinum]MVA45960.1 cytochrome-c oxidase, cbb3-type subunit III [Agrobacterium vitis]GEO86479.1 Cbb3-type cytochrome c oxidase subunit [Ciceribacter naphthalenivorans]GLR23836.1 Cbb3-type cytochrome c oxidase subunit [Ciceribacter naphthalenivorans]GLT06692.1 Cbb3-type cytochrome c oxidase subunit [Sphingomonas psychrolutea]
MDLKDVDPVTGRKTTGHVWNGIRELDTPIPKGVLLFLIVTHLFAVLWWFLMPSWPLGATYTKGILGKDQRTTVEESLVESEAARVPWVTRIDAMSFDEIRADQPLMAKVRSNGHQLFGDNCAACHGRDGKGGANYPNLTDADWIWGGTAEQIAQTLIVGINSRHPDTRIGQMPAFGRDEILDRQQVRDVSLYVRTLSDPAASTAENIGQVDTGRAVFQTNCVACHGDDGRGNLELGAPNLADQTWIYGGTPQTIIDTIHGGRQGHMPTWDERLSPVEIKVLALYVNALGPMEP